jgi:NACHT domain
MKTSQISNKLEDLDDSLKNRTDTVLEQLETLLATFQEAQDEIKKKYILKSLAFADMDARFHTIHAAEPETFDWIFDNPDMLFEKESSLAINFTDWLKSGSGIFHIVGKPGSGKSTLMKFLCEHESTQEYLEEWASADGEKLIFCQFFFWRITTVPEQKTPKGLICSLLYSVIFQVPSLCSRLFPKRWEVKKGASHSGLQISLGDREILDAFEALMHDTQIFEEFDLCFFIDGLDEFERNINLQSETHASLATKLQKWAAQSNGHIKMCVSSRPLLEFTRTFPIAQQITLQKLTESDIHTLVTNRLEQNGAFAELRERSEDENCRCDELVQMILKEAEGVFLWVVLILIELERALANSDSLEVLERIVARAHKEIREFVKDILESIPELYKQDSYYLLAVVMRMAGVVATEAVAVAALQARVNAAIAYYHAVPYIDLEECAMLFDAADKGNLLDCDESLALITRDFHQDNGAIAKEKERLVARCRGLAEVDKNLKIRFTHRAIPEALQTLFFGNEIKESVRDESVVEVLTWIMLADIRRRWKDEYQMINANLLMFPPRGHLSLDYVLSSHLPQDVSRHPREL